MPKHHNQVALLKIEQMCTELIKINLKTKSHAYQGRRIPRKSRIRTRHQWVQKHQLQQNPLRLRTLLQAPGLRSWMLHHEGCQNHLLGRRNHTVYSCKLPDPRDDTVRRRIHGELQIARLTINDAAVFYTDGSVDEDGRSGAAFIYNGEQFLTRLSDGCSSMQAEMVAIQQATAHATTLPTPNIIMHTDSRSTMGSPTKEPKDNIRLTTSVREHPNYGVKENCHRGGFEPRKDSWERSHRHGSEQRSFTEVATLSSLPLGNEDGCDDERLLLRQAEAGRMLRRIGAVNAEYVSKMRPCARLGSIRKNRYYTGCCNVTRRNNSATSYLHHARPTEIEARAQL
ncbi:hypothetical protein O3P69_016237 [Scylla paramamosain]|uniref:RNase H type-1 domain-containing protein n=1 Tax=Scylla paramamosain TaxID=85552 RepID=A0AAW0SA97_SCYPA